MTRRYLDKNLLSIF